MSHSMPARLLSVGDVILTYNRRALGATPEPVIRVLTFQDHVMVLTKRKRYSFPPDGRVDITPETARRHA